MTDPGDTIPMFEVPEKYRPPVDAKPDRITWTTHKGARTSCDDCLRNIANGTNSHFSEPASWVRITATSREFYCYRHGFAKKTMDELGPVRKEG